jgi:membrane dipeptidase
MAVRKTVLITLVPITLAISVSLLLAAPPVTDAEVAKVHRSALLIDTHNDVTTYTVDGYDIGGPENPERHTSLKRLRQGGVGATFFAAYVSGSFAKEGRATHRALEMIDTVRRDIVERYPKDFLFARTAADIERARKEGRMAALIGIEGGAAIQDSLRLLRNFYDLGVRYMTLTHSASTGWAGSSGDAPRNEGLSPFGKQVVREMNRLGMIVDISHVSDQTFRDVLEVSSAPPFASHSSCRALANTPRNMTDEMIAALAKKGGVIQINFYCGFISQAAVDARAAKQPMPQATLAQVVDHIDHAVKVAGVDAVGIGSDYDGIDCAPTGLEDASKFPNLTRALLERGYSAQDIHKIYGGNTLRLMRAVEKAAAVR